MKKLGNFVFMLIVLQNTLSGQTASVSFIEAEAAAQEIIGPGATIVPGTIVFSGLQLDNQNSEFQMGKFDISGFNDIPSGIIFSTGKANRIIGANSGNTDNRFDRSGDNDLTQLSGINTPMRDAVFLEFSFIPHGNNLQLSFVFASDEYPEFISASKFDIFGIFVSGSTITGQFSNASENFALVPGTGTPISVQSVNGQNGSPFFRDDAQTSSFLQLDGRTSLITFNLNVNCGETYRIKIGIQDVGDAEVDSWVIVKSGSLSSPFVVEEIQVNPPGPYCEGSSVQLSTTYDAGYSYLWNTGATTNSITVNTSNVNNPYSVLVTNIDGCEVTRQKEMVIHAQQNSPPQLSGVNGTDENCVMTNVGQEVCFTVEASDPQNNELIQMQNVPPSVLIKNNGDPSIPVTESVNDPVYQICWTPQIGDVGTLNFTLEVADDNACQILTTTRDYCINVVCPNCPTNWDIKYQNKSVAVNDPLPAKTKSPISIETGAAIISGSPNGPVVVGSGEDVLFKAGKLITLNDFSTESGAIFEARIDPSTCLDMEEDCNCCYEWEGFRMVIPNVFTPDGDGFNDVYKMADANHENCLFNAYHVEVKIYNRFSEKVFEGSAGTLGECCSITSADTQIEWNGKKNNTGADLPAAVYYVVTNFYGCGGQTHTYNGTVTLIR